MRTKTRVSALLFALLLAGVAGAGVAVAAGGGARETGNPEGVSPPVAADAPGARLALVLDANETVGITHIHQNKGVQSVTNPATGIFCVKAAPSAGIRAGRAVPTVTVEWNFSANDQTVVQWNAVRQICGAGTFEVRGFDTGGDQNNVGFTMVIT
jgi:uncharacterized protein YbjT (DUF2867 family)